MATHAIDSGKPGRLSRVGHFLLHEFRQMLPPTIFFFIGFNLILFTKRLILEDYLIQFTGFFLATVSALVVGKVVLVAEMMPLLRRFDGEPLAKPILFKTVVYTLLVFIARLLEAFIHYVAGGGAIGRGGFIEEQLGSFSWHRFIATQCGFLCCSSPTSRRTSLINCWATASYPRSFSRAAHRSLNRHGASASACLFG